MNRVFSLALVVIVLAGCRLPDERLPPPQLPEDSAPRSYSELIFRARLQASAANESFYVNRWTELEESAKGLEQTSRFLPKSTEIPEKRKTNLEAEAVSLGKEAKTLLDNAKAKDVNAANETLQRINLKVRELRVE